MMPSRPKILYVTSECPCGPAYGGRLRAFYIGKFLQRIGDVSLVLVPSEPIPQEDIEETRRSFELKGIMPLKVSPRTLLTRLKREWDPRFFGITGQTVSEADRGLLLQLFQKHDLIWFNTVKLPDAFRMFRWKRSILDVDNLPSQYYLSRAAASASLLGRFFDMRMVYLWRRRERLFLDRFDILCVCSNQDRALFKFDERTYVIGNGYEVVNPVSQQQLGRAAEPRFGFIGTLDYEANYKGIHWFVKKVWPQIKKDMPNVRLRLVGKGTDGEIGSRGIDIDGLGWVAEIGKEIESWTAMIVPVQEGGGTRIKIAEAFARKCPVITTTIGVYGYDVESGRETIIADTPSAFAKACVDIIRNPALRNSLTENAFQGYLRHWTWEAQADNVARAVRHCLDRQNSEAPKEDK